MPHKREDILKKYTAVLNAFLDQNQLKHTPERLIILTAVCSLRRFTMAELQDSIIEHSISRATVYNTLALLEKANIILRLEKDFGVRAQQYELVNNKDSFVHIICQKCGRVKKVSDATIARMLADTRWSNFVPQHFSLYVYGKCRVCKNKLNDKQG